MTVVDRAEKLQPNVENGRQRHGSDHLTTPAPAYPARPASDTRSIRRGASAPPERLVKPVLMDPSSPLLHQVLKS